jgi:hypothetical protein
MNEEQAAIALKAFGSDFLKVLSVGAKALQDIAKALDRQAEATVLLAQATAGEFDDTEEGEGQASTLNQVDPSLPILRRSTSMGMG